MNSSELLSRPEGSASGRGGKTLRGWSGMERMAAGIACRAKNGGVRIAFADDGVVRVTSHYGDYRPESETGVVLKPSGEPAFTVDETDSAVTIARAATAVTISKADFTVSVVRDGVRLTEDRAPCSWRGASFRIEQELRERESVYGLGEKTGFLDKRGRTYAMWNTDVFAPHTSVTDPLYVSVPFFIVLGSERRFGFFLDNSYRSRFDMGEGDENAYTVSAEGGNLDYYVICGETPEEIVARYAGLTGRSPMPPAWAIGHHQSRYSYRSEAEVLSIAEEYRRRDIPCEAIHLDIHHMDGFRTFTWDENQFPEPAAMTEDLKKSGIRTVAILDPGIKVDPDYPAYRELMEGGLFCRYADGRPYVGKVWPGETAFPDFVREEGRRWWAEKVLDFMDSFGVDGIWHDMNEPSVFNEDSTMDARVVHGGPGVDSHARYHNLYALYQNQAVYDAAVKKRNRRPFILTRAGFAGIQRYAAVWTGDNRSMWEHLEMSIPMILNMGLSGLPFVGADIGGFANNADGELLVRWYQAGAFYPFARNHCELEARPQEPWAFGTERERLIRAAIRLRYSLMAEFYTAFHRSHRSGRPVLRPLVYDFPNDPNVRAVHDQFLFGDSLMVAPVVRPGSDHRMAYLPEGAWFDFRTGERLEGGRWVVREAPIDRIPIFIRGGRCLMTVDPDAQPGHGTLTFTLFLSGSTPSHAWQVYADDGESLDYERGIYRLDLFRYRYDGSNLRIERGSEGTSFPTQYAAYRFVIVTEAPLASVRVDGKDVEAVAGDGRIEFEASTDFTEADLA